MLRSQKREKKRPITNSPGNHSGRIGDWPHQQKKDNRWTCFEEHKWVHILLALLDHKIINCGGGFKQLSCCTSPHQKPKLQTKHLKDLKHKSHHLKWLYFPCNSKDLSHYLFQSTSTHTHRHTNTHHILWGSKRVEKRKLGFRIETNPSNVGTLCVWILRKKGQTRIGCCSREIQAVEPTQIITFILSILSRVGSSLQRCIPLPPSAHSTHPHPPPRTHQDYITATLTDLNTDSPYLDTNKTRCYEEKKLDKHNTQ